MAKKSVYPYSLQSGTVDNVAASEIDIILRAADPLIGAGSRTMLTKILKGSREKKLLAYGLDKNPAYGAFKDQPSELITNKIDWCIQNRFMYIDYEGRLPVLYYTETGWDIEREIFAEELYQEMLHDVERGQTAFIEHMLSVNPACVLVALEKLGAVHDERTMAILNEWLPQTNGKVKRKLKALLGVR